MAPVVTFEQESLRPRGSVRLAFRVGETAHEATLIANGADLRVTGESLLAVTLLPSMSTGSAIRLDTPIDGQLLESVHTIQEIVSAWVPRLKPVAIKAPTRIHRSSSRRGNRVGLFFSGGVDSFYSLIRTRTEITDLILLHGFDIARENIWLRQSTSSVVREIADEMEVGLVEIETPLNSCLSPYLPFTWFQGAHLATIAHLLSSEFRRIIIPSSIDYKRLIPLGTHPLLDPLWSSSGLEIVHHGAEANRVDKVRELVDYDLALRTLRVCYSNLPGVYNCGRCEKCVRTMVSLATVGALGKCRTLPEQIVASTVLRYTSMQRRVAPYVREHIEALRMAGNRDDLLRALETVERRDRRKRFWQSFRRMLRPRTRLLEAVRTPLRRSLRAK